MTRLQLTKALQFIQEGKWQEAHTLVQDLETKEAAHIHAFLHRIEGDYLNAKYWYDRAQEPVFNGSKEAEWTILFDRYLS